LEKLLSGGWIVKIKSGIKRINLYRWFLAKLFFDEEGLSLEQFLCFQELHLQFSLEGQKEFNDKWGDLINNFVTNEVLPLCQKTSSWPLRFELKNEETLRTQFRSWRVPTREEYFGLKSDKRMLRGYRVIFKCQLPDQKLPPKRFVGVGYRDKGSRRNDSDGTPHWTTVASDARYQDGYYRDIRSGTWKKDADGD